MPTTTSVSLLEKLTSMDAGIRDPAWSRFVFLYTPMLMNWARKQGFEPGDAEDLVQEVLVKLMGTLSTYRKQPGGSFRGWLMTVLCNLGYDYRRRKATRQWGSANSIEDLAAQNPWIDIEEAEFRQWIVHRGLSLIRDDFAPETWKAFTGLVMEGKPAQLVGRELGMSVNAVYLARHRILARLREELMDFIDDL